MPTRRRPVEPIDTPYPHGTDSSYRMGCGCPPCAQAHTDARWERRSRQLDLFPEMARPGARAHQRRPKVPQVPDGLDLVAVAALVADPEPRWAERARCAGRADMRDRFHREVVVQRRGDGTESYSPAGEFVPASYQGWCAECPVRENCVASAIAYESARYRTGYYGSTPTQRGHIVAALRALEPAS